jgi:hypothetical protein
MTRSYLGYVSSQTTDTIVVQGYGTATGGTTLGSPPAGYTVLEFTSSGTLTVTKAGLFDVMVVGGGGAGGLRLSVAGGGAAGAGGGGGGAVQQTTIYLDANATVTVGAKGVAPTAGNTDGARGTFSRVNDFTAGGGGGGGAGAGANLVAAGSGAGDILSVNNPTLVPLNANNGGQGLANATAQGAGGGGGGSTSVGGDFVAHQVIVRAAQAARVQMSQLLSVAQHYFTVQVAAVPLSVAQAAQQATAQAEMAEVIRRQVLMRQRRTLGVVVVVATSRKVAMAQTA